MGTYFWLQSGLVISKDWQTIVEQYMYYKTTGILPLWAPIFAPSSEQNNVPVVCMQLWERLSTWLLESVPWNENSITSTKFCPCSWNGRDVCLPAADARQPFTPPDRQPAGRSCGCCQTLYIVEKIKGLGVQGKRERGFNCIPEIPGRFF